MFYLDAAEVEQDQKLTFKGQQQEHQDNKSFENDDKSSATQQEGIQSKSFANTLPLVFCSGLVVQKTSLCGRRNIYGLGQLWSAEKKAVKNVMYSMLYYNNTTSPSVLRLTRKRKVRILQIPMHVLYT
jgi:hypothetical protein